MSQRLAHIFLTNAAKRICAYFWLTQYEIQKNVFWNIQYTIDWKGARAEQAILHLYAILCAASTVQKKFASAVRYSDFSWVVTVLQWGSEKWRAAACGKRAFHALRWICYCLSHKSCPFFLCWVNIENWTRLPGQSVRGSRLFFLGWKARFTLIIYTLYSAPPPMG